MISCRHCGVANTVTSKFCTQCGWALDASEAQAVSVDLASEVAKGQKLFSDNKIVEAIAIAETVLLVDPENVPALALKGDCLERSGDIEGALAAYEDVVTLKPDSPLDRIRVAQLRRMANAPQYQSPEAPNRRASILAGVAAFVLLTSAGSAVVLANRKDRPVSDVQTVQAEEQVQSVPFSSPAPVPTQSKQPVKTGNSGDSGQEPSGSQNIGASQPLPGNDIVRQNQTKVAPNKRVAFSGPPTSNGDGYRPVDPGAPTKLESPIKTTITSSDPDPEPEKVAVEKASDKTERAPIIDIHPSQPEPKTSGGSQSRDDNEGTALIRVARQYFLAGEYDKAAKAYERAIKLGASTASANHRLAQCYLNLRKRAEALGAYQKALSAYQHMLAQGIGDKKLVGTYIDECKQAIKLLQ